MSLQTMKTTNFYPPSNGSLRNEVEISTHKETSEDAIRSKVGQL